MNGKKFLKMIAQYIKKTLKLLKFIQEAGNSRIFYVTTTTIFLVTDTLYTLNKKPLR